MGRYVAGRLILPTRSGIARAVSMAHRSGIPAASDAELAQLRKELLKSA